MTDPIPPALPVGKPDSLAQRAPVRVEFTDQADRPVRLTRTGLRVRAGDRLVVKVVLRAARDARPVHVGMNVVGRLGLDEVVTPCRIVDGANQAWTATYQAVLANNWLPDKFRRWWPAPGYARLAVAVSDGESKPSAIDYCVEIWPRRWMFLFYGALIAVTYVLVPAVSDAYGRHHDLGAVADELIAKPWAAASSAVGSVLAAAGLYLANHVVALTGWAAPSDGG